MTLRKKTLLTFGIMCAALVVVLYGVSRTILLRSFAELEEQSFSRSVHRTINIFNEHVAQLDRLTADWAARDDTCRFMEDGNEGYIKSNLVDGTFSELGVNVMLFVGVSGRLVFAKGFDLNEKREMPVPKNLLDHAHADGILVKPLSVKESLKGVLLLPKGPMVISSNPIVNSKKPGPARGVMIMGRYLDAAEVARLGRLARLPISIARYEDFKRTSNGDTLKSSSWETSPVHVTALNEETAVGYGLIRDIYENPALVLTVTMPREIYATGQTTLAYFLVSLAAVSAIFVFASLFFLEKSIISRVSQLHRTVKRVAANGNLSKKASVRGNDEISSLARETNEMLASMKKSQDNLKESERKYRTILEGMEEGYFETDMDGRFTFFNNALPNVLGYAKDELLSMNSRQCMTPESAKELYGVFDSVKKTGEPAAIKEAEVRTKDGNSRVLEMSVALMRDEKEQPVGFRGITHDITETKRLQAQLLHAQKMESIGTIAGGVAHNFRNILAGISGFSQLLEVTHRNDRELQHAANRIGSLVDRGAQLISRLMQFSRQEKGSAFSPVNLTEVIKDTYYLIEDSFSNKIEINMNLPGPLFIIGDESSLRQVFMNLCTNARDAMPNGGILSLQARKKDDSAEILISDNGLGMNDETLQRCFDPFFTTKEPHQGTGLGLSTTYGVVKDHGGVIEVFSEPGAGTTFRLRFPLATERVETEEIQKPLTPPIPVEGKKVLVVDDEKDIVETLLELLSLSNYKAISAMNGEEAIDKYRSWQPDVVLMDRSMPGMDGITCAKRILADDPEARIVVLSGLEERGANGIDKDVRASLKGYLTKPIKMAQLTETLARLFDE